jgi:hypothetical protein
VSGQETGTVLAGKEKEGHCIATMATQLSLFPARTVPIILSLLLILFAPPEAKKHKRRGQPSFYVIMYFY